MEDMTWWQEQDAGQPHFIHTESREREERKWKEAMDLHHDKLSKTAPLKGSMTSSHSISNCGLSAQIHEHMGNVSGSDVIHWTCLRI